VPSFDLLINSSTTQRLDQLSEEGKNPDLIRRLANDAKKWAEFRDSLRDQAYRAKEFVLGYGQRYNESQSVKKLQQLIDEFESSINNRIGRLDQTVRDLSQIVSSVDYFLSISVELTFCRSLRGSR
jgi:hypothetical protein